jgi:hypothetical protein
VQIFQGNDRTIDVTVRDATGNALDLTNATLDYQLSPRDDESTQLVSLSDGGGINVTSAADGELEIVLTNTDTDLAPDIYVHELRVTLPSGKVFTVFHETVTVKNSLFVPTGS